MSKILKLLFKRKIGNKIVIKHISNENIWATPLIPPSKAYLELLDQPANIIPKTLKDEMDKKKNHIQVFIKITFSETKR